MAEPDLRLTAADGVLINAAAMIVCAKLHRKNDYDLALDVAREHLGRGNPHNPFMQPVVEELRILTATPTREAAFSAQCRLGDAMAQLFKWRLGGALDAIQSKG